jgi:quercetin dioxygenase-like cupin family protein
MTLYRWDSSARRFTSSPFRDHQLSGEKVLLKSFEVEKGCTMEAGAACNDTLICLLRGALRVRVASDELIVRDREAVMIPFGFRHSAEAIEDSFALQMLREPRAADDDYLWGV